MSNYYIDNNRIIFENGASIKFDFPICDSIAINDLVIVVLDIIDNSIFNRHVFAINSEGNIEWQIEKSENLDLIGYCPFVSVEIHNLNLVLFNWCGFKYEVNPKTGKVINTEFTK